jgi:hypothetical protein
MTLSGIRTVATGVLRGQWRRGSSWRVGLGSYDLTNHRISVWDGMPLLGREIGGHATVLTADPYLFRWQDTWYLFYESFPPGVRGQISVSRSTDLVDWDHLGPVVSSDHHLSYPTVTVVDGEPRLVVESSSAREVAFLRPQDFPTRWHAPVPMLRGEAFADPTPFRHEGRWWLFVETSGGSHDALRLYWTTDDDWTAWKPHPGNPICTDARWARPAGPLLRRPDGSIIRFGQDNSRSGVYGRQVAALAIEELDLTHYRERFVGNVTFQRRPSWAHERSHHVCVVPLGDGRAVAAVDGRGYLTLTGAVRARLGTTSLGRQRR